MKTHLTNLLFLHDFDDFIGFKWLLLLANTCFGKKLFRKHSEDTNNLVDFIQKYWKFEKTHVFWTFLSFIEYQKDSNFVKTWIFADLESQNLQNRPSNLSGKNRGVLASFHMKKLPKTCQLRAEIQVVASMFHIGWSSAFKIGGWHHAGLF